MTPGGPLPKKTYLLRLVARAVPRVQRVPAHGLQELPPRGVEALQPRCQARLDRGEQALPHGLSRARRALVLFKPSLDRGPFVDLAVFRGRGVDGELLRDGAQVLVRDRVHHRLALLETLNCLLGDLLVRGVEPRHEVSFEAVGRKLPLPELVLEVRRCLGHRRPPLRIRTVQGAGNGQKRDKLAQ